MERGECQICATGGGTPDVRAVALNRSFGRKRVLRDFEICVHHGETYVIIGRSGCGKSVLLKHVVGLLRPDSGLMCVLGHDVNRLSKKRLLELHRHIGMVFQGCALLASLTVRDNIALGLQEKGVPEDEIDRIAAEKLALVSMQDTEGLYPDELSGGMRKRVAVARTLAMEPQVILYDEPTTGLDPVTSDDVDDLIMDMKAKIGATSIIVTHDMFTAFRVGDRIGMMHEGHIIAEGTPDEILASEDKVVQEFIARTRPERTSRT